MPHLNKLFTTEDTEGTEKLKMKYNLCDLRVLCGEEFC